MSNTGERVRKVPMALRLDAGLAAWIDEYAERGGVRKVALVEAALRAFRAGVVEGLSEMEGVVADWKLGVPDLEQASAGSERSQPSRAKTVRATPAPAAEQVREAGARMAERVLPPGVSTASELAMARMRKMNPGRYG